MDFADDLKKQLGFIYRSCEWYDLGHKEEALRIAVNLRVLFHDTKSSDSLLSHLGKKESIHLISTIGSGKTRHDFKAREILLPLMFSLEGVRPLLGEHGNSVNLKIDDWWNEVIMSQDNVFSREDIVLAAADRDGGAHVDKRQRRSTGKTGELKAGIGTFTTFTNGVEVTEDLIDYHYPLLRQLGYEVLHSPELISLAK